MSPGSRRLPSGTIATPAPRTCSGRRRVRSSSPSSTRPLVDAQHAADRQHERRLAGAVRAEQRRDLARRDRERHVVQHAAAAARDAQLLEAELGPGGRLGRAHGTPRSPRRPDVARRPRRPRCRGRPASRSRRAAPRPSARSRSACRSRARPSSCSRPGRGSCRGRRGSRARRTSPGCPGSRRARCSVSSSGSPAAGSSSSTTLGAPTTARAISTRRRSRAPSPPTLTSGAHLEADVLDRAQRRRPAARRARLPSARGSSRRCRTPTAARSPSRSGTCAAAPSARAGSRPS